MKPMNGYRLSSIFVFLCVALHIVHAIPFINQRREALNEPSELQTTNFKDSLELFSLEKRIGFRPYEGAEPHGGWSEGENGGRTKPEEEGGDTTTGSNGGTKGSEDPGTIHDDSTESDPNTASDESSWGSKDGSDTTVTDSDGITYDSSTETYEATVQDEYKDEAAAEMSCSSARRRKRQPASCQTSLITAFNEASAHARSATEQVWAVEKQLLAAERNARFNPSQAGEVETASANLASRKAQAADANTQLVTARDELVAHLDQLTGAAGDWEARLRWAHGGIADAAGRTWIPYSRWVVEIRETTTVLSQDREFLVEISPVKLSDIDIKKALAVTVVFGSAVGGWAYFDTATNATTPVEGIGGLDANSTIRCDELISSLFDSSNCGQSKVRL